MDVAYTHRCAVDKWMWRTPIDVPSANGFRLHTYSGLDPYGLPHILNRKIHYNDASIAFTLEPTFYYKKHLEHRLPRYLEKIVSQLTRKVYRQVLWRTSDNSLCVFVRKNDAF
jgi:hypothetical protein